MSLPSGSPSEPTDLELMAYLDGELDPERREEVARFLAASHGAHAREAQAKLDALDALGQWVRADAGGAFIDGGAASIDARDEALTESILARVAAEAPAPPEERTDDRGGRAESSPPRVPRGASAPPANDNGGLLWGLVAVAAAAAAALFFWGKGAESPDGPSMARVVDAPSAAPATESSAQLGEPARAPAPAAVAERDDDSTGVEIAAVDFGAATGAIYYVPKGDDLVGAATTTVVWLADE